MGDVYKVVAKPQQPTKDIAACDGENFYLFTKTGLNPKTLMWYDGQAIVFDLKELVPLETYRNRVAILHDYLNLGYNIQAFESIQDFYSELSCFLSENSIR